MFRSSTPLHPSLLHWFSRVKTLNDRSQNAIPQRVYSGKDPERRNKYVHQFLTGI